MAVDDQYTVSLMHFDGNLTDESGKTWTAYGGATTSAAAAKFGSAGLQIVDYQYLTGPFTPGTGDFTLEVFINKADSGLHGLTQAGNDKLNLDVAGIYDGSSHSFSSNLPVSVWTHVAIVRHAGVITVYFGGVSVCSFSNVVDYSTTITLGRYADNTHTGTVYYDELRISNVARYTANFTPPTVPFSTSTARRRCVI